MIPTNSEKVLMMDFKSKAPQREHQREPAGRDSPSLTAMVGGSSASNAQAADTLHQSGQSRRVIGKDAGTQLKPATGINDIAWSDHRIRFFSDFARGKRVLDVGCVQHDPNNYRSPYWVHNALVAVADHVVGLDLYEEGVGYLRNKGYDVRLADACSFELNEKFDVIVAGDVIEHLDNAGGFLSSCRRHLQPEGVLLVTTDSPWFWRHIARAALFGRVKNNLEHVSWIDPVLLQQLAKRFGFYMDQDEVTYGAREVWLRCLPLPAPLKYPTYHAILRPVE